MIIFASGRAIALAARILRTIGLVEQKIKSKPGPSFTHTALECDGYAVVGRREAGDPGELENYMIGVSFTDGRRSRATVAALRKLLKDDPRYTGLHLTTIDVGGHARAAHVAYYVPARDLAPHLAPR